MEDMKCISKFQKKIDKLENSSNMFKNKYICWFLLLIFIITDFTCVKSALESMITERYILLILLSVVYASILDISCYLAATYLDDFTFKSIKENFKVKLLIGVFAIFFIGYVVLRMSTLQSLYAVSSSLEGNDATVSIDFIHIIFASVLCLIPLGTSLLSLVIGFKSRNEKRNEVLNEIKNQKNLINLKKARLLAEIAETKSTLETDLNAFDQQNYVIQKEMIYHFQDDLKMYARRSITQKLNTPEIIDQLGKVKFRKEGLKNEK